MYILWHVLCASDLVNFRQTWQDKNFNDVFTEEYGILCHAMRVEKAIMQMNYF